LNHDIDTSYSRSTFSQNRLNTNRIAYSFPRSAYLTHRLGSNPNPSVPTPPISSLLAGPPSGIPLQNFGVDCWQECGRQGGMCPNFCGSLGACCRDGFGEVIYKYSLSYMYFLCTCVIVYIFMYMYILCTTRGACAPTSAAR